jgi:hypothetical protein
MEFTPLQSDGSFVFELDSSPLHDILNIMEVERRFT